MLFVCFFSRPTCQEEVQEKIYSSIISPNCYNQCIIKNTWLETKFINEMKHTTSITTALLLIVSINGLAGTVDVGKCLGNFWFFFDEYSHESWSFNMSFHSRSLKRWDFFACVYDKNWCWWTRESNDQFVLIDLFKIILLACFLMGRVMSCQQQKWWWY